MATQDSVKSPPPPGAPPPTGITVDQRASIVRVGLTRRWWQDLYHFFLATSWSRVMAILVGIYFVANLLFATGYWLCRGGIENSSGSFLDSFFFSVQTWATIGYGRMVPRSIAANLLVTVEALSGLLCMALVAGLLFAKFARPTARVLFSRVAVMTKWDGRPALMFRLANQRGNQIVDAVVTVTLARQEVTIEGESLRRNYDLALLRQRIPFLALSWSVIHIVDEASPLRGVDAAALARAATEVTASVQGLDGTVSQTVHAHHTYGAGEIIWGARFADILSRLPDGRLAVDYTRFHDLLPPPQESPPFTHLNT